MGVVKAHEPMSVQAFLMELSVEAFDESIVGRLAGTGEVKNDTLLVSPQIQIAGDKLTAIVHTD